MKISRLQYLVTSPSHAKLAAERGLDWIQLRLKDTPYEDWKKAALVTQAICRDYNATFILNDNPHLAQEIGANGVHLGKQDMPPAEARALLGPGFIIGGTANTFADIEHLAAAGVDYIGLGPFRFTTTKQNLSPVLGLMGYEDLLAQCRATTINIPLIGIGGITLNDVGPLLDLGLHGVAVASAITKAYPIARAINDFISSVSASTEHRVS
ncbi:thiamine phosphate synthase [Hymenobacter setariae]|uniref:Thiamine-phosphate synthase n=1 Tax=Hymenobacter setariae TaxID=2594794 RepID=A0A558BUG7_9BACT|nr:thiamine phosphate synthase [Hymenobacter setariae]TVT40142.1 thiamine phosphate synthase [Hymenobacter setariae]